MCEGWAAGTPIIVVKFGGTSVASASAVLASAEIVRGRLLRRPIVVVSALAGVTNALLALAQQATAGQLLAALQGLESLRSRHLAEADALVGMRPELCEEVGAELSVL